MRFVSRIFITDQCKFGAFHNITKCLHFTNSLSFSSKLWHTKVSIAQYIYASKAKKKTLLKMLPVVCTYICKYRVLNFENVFLPVEGTNEGGWGQEQWSVR